MSNLHERLSHLLTPTASGGALPAPVPVDLVFDDDPVAEAVRDDSTASATPVTVFAESRRMVARARQTTSQAELVALINNFLAAHAPIHAEDYRVMRPAIALSLAGLQDADAPETHVTRLVRLEQAWRLAERFHDEEMLRRIGSGLPRAYELRERFDDARRIHRRLLEIARRHENRHGEAVAINNIGFSYFLEKRPADASPHFSEAAKLQKALGNDVEVANARINYWTCRFDLVGADCADAMHGEMWECLVLLRDQKDWRERKACRCLARCAVEMGDRRQAVELAQRAVQISRELNDMYLVEDEELLCHLTETQP